MWGMSPKDEPAVARIAAKLRRQIASGEFAPGDPFPSEQAIADQEGVARMTARRAVDQLRIEGLVLSAPNRRGSWVNDYKPLVTYLHLAERGERLDNPALALDDWAAGVAAQGRKPYQVTTVHVDEMAEPNVAAWLRIRPGEPVVRRHRYREVDDVPVQLVDSWFPADIASLTLPGTNRMPLREDGDVVVAGGILHGLGQDQVRIEPTYTARNANPWTAESLSMPVGGALLVMRWVGFRADDRPVRAMVVTAVGDRNEFADVIRLNAVA
jgi:DNA-binding GntR family transcriptional regulator